MLRYAALNLAVLLGVVAWQRWSKVLLSGKQFAFTLGPLLVLTAVFDSIIVGTHIVAYNTSNILGIYIGKAPIEDFCYTIAAVIIVPLLWEYYARKN